MEVFYIVLGILALFGVLITWAYFKVRSVFEKWSMDDLEIDEDLLK